MAEITKVTTPMIPKENIGNKFKPVTDQAFDLTDPAKVHKKDPETKASDRQATDSQTLLKESMGRAAILPLLKNTDDMLQTFRKIIMMVEVGVSASDVVSDASVKELLDSLFLSPEQFGKALMEQDQSSVLFKGDAFDVLRDIVAKFEGSSKVQDSLANLLRAFDANVNSQNSIKTILFNCTNILDFMFSRDREQFSNYLQGLAEMLLPKEEAVKQPVMQQPVPGGAQSQQAAQQDATQTGQAQGAPPFSEQVLAEAKSAMEQELMGAASQRPEAAATEEPKTAQAAPAEQLPPKEIAQLLKNNLLPLLGEIVVKYHQNEKIRDIVMVVVHNIVRVDQGTPEALAEAVKKLARELKQLANLPENFERNLLEVIKQNIGEAKSAQNGVVEKLAAAIEDTLRSSTANPAVQRQAGNMLMSMLQNQSSLMDVLHFMLPMQTPEGHVFTELYVDPETEESVTGRSGKSRKFFLSIESEAHGSFELSFLETGERVDFAMWCPENLVKPLSGLKRHLGDIMQTYGYTMNSCKIDRMTEPHSVAEVFPRLLNRRIGIDVRI